MGIWTDLYGMATFTTEGSMDGGFLPAAPATPIAVAYMATITAGLGSKQDVEDECDLIATLIRSFAVLEPDEVLSSVSALTARLTELAICLHRVEGSKREYRQVRTRQVEQLLKECDRQQKIASRLLEVRRQDIEALRGSR